MQPFRKPSLTSQITHCPVPFHLDTYMGCGFGCTYCFAKDLVCFARRNSENKEFSYIVANNHEAFATWLDKVMAKDTATRSEEVALRERLVLKIGANSDPFPYKEKELGITLGFLKALHKYDYPVELQTKNPAGILAALKQHNFDNPNWTIAVTIISCDEAFVKTVEVAAPTVKNRFAAIKKLTEMGLKVMVKIQPCVYPKIMTDLPDLIAAIKENGCWAFNTEGLKIRVSMPKDDQEKINENFKGVHANIRDFYKQNKNEKSKADYELNDTLRLKYINLATELAKKHSLRYFVADNGMGCVGCSDECCGTEVLRNYKLWRHNSRSAAFGNKDLHCKALEDCICDFIRCADTSKRTIKEVVDSKNKEKTNNFNKIPWR